MSPPQVRSATPSSIAQEAEDSTAQITWDAIVAIDPLPPEPVYDIEVEGTHNFVANGIIAHNTYLKGATADTTAAALNVVNSGATSLLYARNDGNVGVGTTTPAQKLSVVGTIESTSGGFKFPDGSLQTLAVQTTNGFNPLDTGGSITTGLVAYLKFNETSGTTVADSVGSNNGTATGTTIMTGKLSKARNFNGSSDWVSVPGSTAVAPASALTVSTWFKPTAMNNVLLCNLVTDGYQLNSSATTMFFYLYTGGTEAVASTTSLPSTGAWHHAVGTWDGATVKLYLDGVLKASVAKTGTMSASGNVLGIGARPAGDSWFNGVMDEVGIWNRALSAQEVADLYDNYNRTSSVISGWTSATGKIYATTATDSVGIGTDTPAATAILDVSSPSNNKGFLAPRMTTTQRDAITTPAAGLLIYNSTTNAYNVYNGTSWREVVGTTDTQTLTNKTLGSTVMQNDATLGQAAGPLLAFDDTNNYLELIPKPVLRLYNHAMSRPGERGQVHGVAWGRDGYTVGTNSGPPAAGQTEPDGGTPACRGSPMLRGHPVGALDGRALECAPGAVWLEEHRPSAARPVDDR